LDQSIIAAAVGNYLKLKRVSFPELLSACLLARYPDAKVVELRQMSRCCRKPYRGDELNGENRQTRVSNRLWSKQASVTGEKYAHDFKREWMSLIFVSWLGATQATFWYLW